MLAWLFWLLGFFPGMMSPDSMDQWRQALGAPLGDAHPLAHTLLTRLLIQIWPSPAIVVAAQIVALGLVWGWGCASLIQFGIPRKAVLVSSVLVATSLVVGALVVTLWKDVAFSIAMTALMILLASLGLGMKPSARYWIAFGTAAGLATLFRHNGILGLVGGFGGLLVISPSLWKRTAATLIVTLILTFGLRAWLFHEFRVKPFRAVPQLLLGVLGAHVAGGTPLNAEEGALLEQIHPLADAWHYQCADLDATVYDGELDRVTLARRGAEIPSLAWVLTRRRPLTTLAHQACASRILWNPFQGDDVTHGPNLWATPNERVRYIQDSPGGPHEASILPGLKNILASAMYGTWNPRWSWLVWRPALPLYLLLGCAAFAGVRRRIKLPIASCFPILFNTAGMALTIGTQDVRYQFSVFLAAMLFCPAWLWLGLRRESDDAQAVGTR